MNSMERAGKLFAGNFLHQKEKKFSRELYHFFSFKLTRFHNESTRKQRKTLLEQPAKFQEINGDDWEITIILQMICIIDSMHN